MVKRSKNIFQCNNIIYCLFNIKNIFLKIHFSHDKEHILSLANFVQYTSTGKLVGDNGTKVIGHDTVSINTIAIPSIPHFGEGGQTEFIYLYLVIENLYSAN